MSRLRFLASDLRYWLTRRRSPRSQPVKAGRAPRQRVPRPSAPSRHTLLVFITGAVLAGGGVAAWAALDGDAFEDDVTPSAPAPRVVVQEDEEPEEAPDLGFPGFATKNTTRIGAADSTAASVGAALAVHPATGGVPGPAAVAVAPADDWAAGLAASMLVADPIGAPILLGDPDGVPKLVLDALVALGPRGSATTEKAQLLVVGDVSVPSGLRAKHVEGANAAELAAGVERLRRELTGRTPGSVLLVSSDEPAFAMPAAAWAARSGDALLFVQRESVPGPTLEALERYRNRPVFILGPKSAISEKAVSDLRRAGVEPERIAGSDSIENAIEFARFAGPGGFGWGIADPGHGFVLANTARPADAAAAAALSAAGKWGPLLLLDDASVLPPALEGYLLDVKPGYLTDPTRAVYNHVWLIGDTDAIGVDVQAQIDELAELARIGSQRR